MSQRDQHKKKSGHLVQGDQPAGELLADYKERSELAQKAAEQEAKLEAEVKKERRRNRALAAIARANTKIPMRWVAMLLAGSTMVSALLGIYRDRLLNSMYLNTYQTGIDAYTAAFSIPDFMFMILVSGALSVTFIPVVNQRMAKNNKKSAWELSTSILNLLALVTLATSVLIIIFAEPLVK